MLLIPATAVLIVMKLMSPIVRFRLFVMAYHRFGHLALEPEQMLSNREIKFASKKNRNPFPILVDIWSLGPRRLQANRYLAKKWKMQIASMPSWIVDSLFHAGIKNSWLGLEVPKLSIYGPSNALDKCASHLSFTGREILRANKELARMGIDSNKPFVCLVVRDSGHYATGGERESIGYDLLNTDISTFELAAQSLAERGYQVVRMGAGSEKSMTIKHANIFDYAKSQDRSAFLDIYLAGNCSFTVSTQTGPDCVSLVFRRPVCYIDIARYSQFFLGTNIACWNPTTLIKNGSRMTLRQIMDDGVALLKDPDDFEKQGIVSIRSTPEAICDLVTGYAQLYEQAFEVTEDEKKTAKLANDIIERGMGEFALHKFGKITAQVNPVFLRQQGDWFLA